MNENESSRAKVLANVREGTLTLEQATSELHLSYRQVVRVWKRFQKEGESGLAHGNRGKPSNRAYPDFFKDDILRRYREQAKGLGPTRFAERLRREGISLDHETVRRWLLDGDLWTLRRASRVRLSTNRSKAGFGEQLNLMSVQGHWLGADLPACFFFCLVDEATSMVLCSLAQNESSQAAMHLLWAWIDCEGIPAIVCCPRRFVYAEVRHPSLEQQLAGEAPQTSFALACERLGIETKVANPMQAKKVLANLKAVTDFAQDALGRRGAATVEEGEPAPAGNARRRAERRLRHAFQNIRQLPCSDHGLHGSQNDILPAS